MKSIVYELRTGALALACTLLIHSSQSAEKPLQIYILAGQSNMEGHAKIETFDHIGLDPKTAPLLAEMRGKDGKPTICEDVWISYYKGLKGGEADGHGQLTAGYGSRRDVLVSGGKIGPEFTFGIYAQKAADGPVLIIKTAWGGKSIHTDFRPPSVGPYEFTEAQLARFKDQGKDLAQVKADKVAATGLYYRLMLGHVERVLADIKRVYPDYDPQAGYELAGFVWFQGWNDMVDSGTYPNRGEPGGYQQYTEVLTHFIRDVRSDLKAPSLPFVIGVMGVDGPVDETTEPRYRVQRQEFRNAMAAPASMPEFRGNVSAVLTENFWDQDLGDLAERWNKVRGKARSLGNDTSLSKEQRDEALEAYTAEIYTPDELKRLKSGTSNAAYHYLGSAKIMAQIGKAFAEAITDLQ